MESKRRVSFLVGCLAEAALLLLAGLWGAVFHVVVFRDLSWNPAHALLGCVASIPPFVFFLWTLHFGLRLFEAHRQLLERVLLPLVGGWSLLQLTVISALAGLCEESLFRGAIQRGLTHSVGTGAALVLASAAFGCAHLITWTYAIIAALIGGYLGSLWIWTGNLLTPMIAHAVYDLAALLYLLRFFQKR